MVTLGWFVCPTASMVTTGKAIGLKKTLLTDALYRGHPVTVCDTRDVS